jgi:NAD(P)H-flavin reductase
VAHTVRAVGAATAALAAARPGDLLASRGPYGTGWDLAAAAGRDVVVVAGGIGLAPLKALVDAVLAGRDRYGSFNVLIGARTPEDLCFAGHLREWRARGDVEVAVTVDRLGRPAHRWPGAIGVVTTLLDAACFDPARATAFVCGPEVMMRATVRALGERGVDLRDVQVSVERSMTCGVGHCGHCQLGPVLVCQHGPCLTADRVIPLLQVRER